MAAQIPVRPALGLVLGGEYQPFQPYDEAPGAIFNQGDFLQVVTTGTITFPNPTPTTAGGLGLFQPSSAPTIANTTRSGEASHTQYLWYTLINSGATHESLPYEIGPVVNAPGQSLTVTVPADSNYPTEAAKFNIYVGPRPGIQWQQVAATTLGSAATIPAWPWTNNIGVNRCANNPASGIIGYACYQQGTGYAQRIGYQLGIGWDWRALFGIDAGASGAQPLFEQYKAQVCKLQNVPVVISLQQAWNPGLIGTTAGIVFNTTYNVFVLDNSQSNAIFTIDRDYGGLAGPYNSQVATVGNTFCPVIGHFNAGLA